MKTTKEQKEEIIELPIDEELTLGELRLKPNRNLLENEIVRIVDKILSNIKEGRIYTKYYSKVEILGFLTEDNNHYQKIIDDLSNKDDDDLLDNCIDHSYNYCGYQDDHYEDGLHSDIFNDIDIFLGHLNTESYCENNYEIYYNIIDKDQDYNILSIEKIMNLMVRLSIHYDIQKDIHGNDFLYHLENEYEYEFYKDIYF